MKLVLNEKYSAKFLKLRCLHDRRTVMGGICCKKKGAKKLKRLNIRTYNPNAKRKIASGPDEIPYWEETYEKYDIKKLAKECKRLMDEINERRERLKKVETSLNEKYEERKDVNGKITEAEKVYEKINQTSKKLIKDVKKKTSYLKENHLHGTSKEDEFLTIPFSYKDVREKPEDRLVIK